MLALSAVVFSLWSTPSPALGDYTFGGKLADDRTRPFFEHADQQRITLMLTDQVCHATGGPCEYRGRSMTDAHKGTQIKREQFDALVEDLQKSMGRFNIPVRSQNKLLAVLASMHRDIEQH